MNLFQMNTTLSLLQKISRHFEIADKVLKICEDYEKAYCTNSNLNDQSNKQASFQSSALSQNNEKSSFSIFSK